MQTVKIFHGSFYGLVGFILPTVMVFVAYPILIDGLGITGFGIFLLINSVTGAFSMLDFGLSSAILKYVAEDLSNGNAHGVADIFATGFIYYCALGAGLALLMWMVAPSLQDMMSTPLETKLDTILAFKIAAFQLVFAMLIALFTSLMKGFNRFDLSCWILSAVSFITYGGAIAAVKLNHGGLVQVVLWGCISNVALVPVCMIFSHSIAKDVNVKLLNGRPSKSTLRRLFSFSSALMVHSVVSMFFGHGQRLLVGFWLGPNAVSVYTIANTLVSKVHAVINAMTEVMFPISSSNKNIFLLRKMYIRVVLTSMLFAGLLLSCLTVFAEQILTIWVGPTLAAAAKPLIGVFALGFFILSFSPPTYHIVNGKGMPWLNVIFDVSNLALAALLMAIVYVTEISLIKIVWAFAISNLIQSLCYQYTVERYCWQKWLAIPNSIRQIPDSIIK